MEDTSPGFSSVYALTMILSLFLVVVALAGFFMVNLRTTERIEDVYRHERIAKAVLSDILEDMQAMKDIPSDCINNLDLLGIIKKYESYSLEVSDVSTGINEVFLSGEVLNSLDVDLLVEEAGKNFKSSYGWVNADYVERDFLSSLQEEHGLTDLFPLVNRFPLNNVNFMEEKHIEAVLNYFDVKAINDKKVKILQNQETGITEEMLLTILDCSKEDKILDFMGVKTSFWKIKMEIEGLSVMAIVAAIPKKEDQRKVSEYVLIEERIIRG